MTGSRNLLAFLLLVAAVPTTAASARQKDYLTITEADKIRDAQTYNDRIKLFLSFASDRLKKFRHELARPTTDRQRGDRLAGLLNAFTGCVDDAAELIDLGREKQEDVRSGIKEMQKKAKEFLPYLERLLAEGPELDSYRETLEDAIEAVKEAVEDAAKAEKEIAPPPVRRKP